jgi:hypothetical protein
MVAISMTLFFAHFCSNKGSELTLICKPGRLTIINKKRNIAYAILMLLKKRLEIIYLEQQVLFVIGYCYVKKNFFLF